MSPSKTHVMLVGNPGTGKSTLLNGLMGQAVFKSGFSPGAGMTDCLQKHEKNGTVYMDTPGLADVNLRQEAAKAITKGLKEGGMFKIFFVFTLEAGRVRPEDKASMELILKSAPIGQNYGVIINKVSERAVQEVANNVQSRDQILGALFMNCDPTVFVYFNNSDDALEDQDNVVKPLSRDLAQFITAMPAVEIRREQVRAVDASNFEQIQERFDNDIENLKKDNDQLRQRLAGMAPAMQSQIQRAQAQNPQMDMSPMQSMVGAVQGIAQIGMMVAGLAGACSVM